MFSSRSFMVSGLRFKSSIHFELIFVYGVKYWSSFIPLHMAIQFSQHHLLKRLSFARCIFLVHCCKFIDHVCMGLFLGTLLFHWYMPIFLGMRYVWVVVISLNFEEEGISKAFTEVHIVGKEELQQCGNGKMRALSDIDQRWFVRMEWICVCRWILARFRMTLDAKIRF